MFFLKYGLKLPDHNYFICKERNNLIDLDYAHIEIYDKLTI